MVVTDDKVQAVLDDLQKILPNTRCKLFVYPIEIALKQSEEQKKESLQKHANRFTIVLGKTCMDGNYFVLVLLSTIVASIGLIENNAAVLIGAMVIAPLLGPNCFWLATALGDFSDEKFIKLLFVEF